MLETQNGESRSMATTQSTLEKLETNLDESIGVRQPSISRPKLSPVASAKDVGRRPLRNFGRIQIDQVIPDPSQPRSEFSDESNQQLAQSIKKKGQFAPIRVRWSPSHEKWIIVYGERRWRAAQAAKLQTIDCQFDENKLTDAEVLEQQMIENLLREDLSPIEQARGFSALMELHGWNGKQVAESLHVPASTISRALALLDLPEDVQRKVDAGELAARSAYEISKLDDETRQRELADQAANGLTLKETQEIVNTRRPKKKSATRNKSRKLEFIAENGWRIIAKPPSDGSARTYYELKDAIDQINDDVELRIRNNIRID